MHCGPRIKIITSSYEYKTNDDHPNGINFTGWKLAFQHKTSQPNFFLQVIWAKHDTSAGHLVYRLISTNCPRCFKLGSPTVLPLPSRAKVGVKTLEEQLANQS